MKTLARVVSLILLLIVLGFVVLLIGARFADGPVEIIAGGPFKTGELVEGPEPDWSFVRDIDEVEFEKALNEMYPAFIGMAIVTLK